ncbi:MAG: hypothetical protein GEU78_09485 [Actinobacteria bacterium]|nr:hypothetical protein [Actinomycetota bacterium]
MDSWSSVPHSVREKLRKIIFERDGFRCQIRGPHCSRAAADLDHILPRNRGGALCDPENLRASCVSCNRGRRHRRRLADSSREW